jgi:hypothetical protein
MSNWSVDPAVTNCIFWDSRAANSGDEIANDLSDPMLSNCDIEGSGESGAGWDAAFGTDGGGNIDTDPLFANVPSRVDLTSLVGTTTTVVIAGADTTYAVNDIIEIAEDDVARTVTAVAGPSTVTFSPALAGPSGTRTLVCNWGPGAVDLILDLRLVVSSLCIDAGDDSALPADTADLDTDGDTTEPLPLDLDGNPRISGSAVDIGAYEYQQ